ncbi:hypothetical protein AB4F11_04205 [Francisella philomiragia]
MTTQMNKYFLTKEENLQKANDIKIRMFDANDDNAYINNVFKAQDLKSRSATDSSHYFLDTETQTSLRNTLNTQGSVAAAGEFLNKAYSALEQGKTVDRNYLSAVEKNILTASAGKKYYSHAEGKVLDFPGGKSIADFDNTQLQSMGLNTEQQSAVANFQYIKNGSYQQRI